MDRAQRWKDQVTMADVKRAHIEEGVPEVSMSASNQEKRTIRIAVAFSEQPARAQPIENTTPKTPQALEVPRKTAPALDTGNHELLLSSRLDYTILICQERETSKLTF